MRQRAQPTLLSPPLCRNLEQAVRWAAAVQRELLKVDWPAGVLEWAECSPETDEGGQLLWRGLRVKAGMAVGHDAAKRPLNTGALRRTVEIEAKRSPGHSCCRRSLAAGGREAIMLRLFLHP